MSDMSHHLSLLERLDEKRERRGPDECWPWLAAKTRGGYGHLKVGKRYIRAHRLQIHLSTGLALDGDWLGLHSCDNPECTNPAHLHTGNQMENVAEQWARGRGVRGEAKGKLTEAQVLEIRRRVASGEESRRVALDYPCSYEQVRRIARRLTWAWLS